MFWRRLITGKASVYKIYRPLVTLEPEFVKFRSFCGFTNTTPHKNLKNVFEQYSSIHRYNYNHLMVFGRYCSKGILDKETDSQSQEETDLQNITKIFPQPRVTLYEFSSRTPQKIFDVHYKPSASAPKSKGSRKKAKKAVQNDWTCTYAFVWPEKIKFEGTALSKRQAAEKAASRALHYLYLNKRIDNKGLPIYDRNKIEELKVSIQEPLRIHISEASATRISNIWEDYESGIKDIYETTIRRAQENIQQPNLVLKRDSTIDEDGYPEKDMNVQDDVDDIADLKIQIHPVYGKTITPPSPATLQRRERVLKQKFMIYDEELSPLPIDEYREQITSAVKSSRVVVLVGAPGCGKSTRAPAAILRELTVNCNAIVSEPRRVAAIGLAERVASELGEQVGESIGYQVRLQSKPPRPPAGSILYCTSGVLLRRLQANPGLEGCTHVFIDEAHERDVNTDVTLLLLRRALDVNKKLNVIIMSATLHTDVITRYFNNCPIIEVPGRTFPVEISYLDEIQKNFNISLTNTIENCKKETAKPNVNCAEVSQVIKAVDRSMPEGAILVFLPGWADIKLTKQLLDEQFSENTHMILPVHSRLSTSDQVKMFSKPMLGIRKIVLATNIAETSITIPDVVYVIDSGALKENTLREETGHCYRLYTKEKEDEFSPHTTPEILRIPLEQTVLDLKTFAPEDKIEDFLSQLPEPPSPKAIQFAVNDLIDLGALTQSEQLTRLGRLLSGLSLRPRGARSLLHGAVVGAALSAGHLAAHTNDHVHVFVDNGDRREEIRNILSEFNSTSDHAALHALQEAYEQKLRQSGRRGIEEWCNKYGLRRDRLNYVKSLSSLYLEQVLRTGIIEPSIGPEELNRFSSIDELTVAILLSGCNSLMRTKRHVKTKGKLSTVVELFTSKGDRAHIGIGSVNYNITKRKSNSLVCYYGGFHSTERRALVVHKTSLIPPHTAILFCMGDVQKEIVSVGNEDAAILTLPRHKLQVHMPASQADLLIKAKEMIWNTFQYHIDRDLKSVDYEEIETISRFKTRLIKAVSRILVEGHAEFVGGEKLKNMNLDD